MIVLAGTWFAAAPEDRSGYSLVGCSVALGFDFEDFELARPEELVSRFQAHRKIIETFTRA